MEMIAEPMMAIADSAPGGGARGPLPNIRRKGGNRKSRESDSVTVRQDFPETWLWAMEEIE